MKPTKNRVYCYDCGRQKMLFEDEKKAENFIKFHQNSDEFDKGYIPKRCYFCVVCAGWHVTSIEIRDDQKITLSAQLINQQIECITDKNRLHQANNKMIEIAKLLKKYSIDFNKCDYLLNEVYYDIQSVPDSLYKESLLGRYRKQKKQLMRHAPEQVELKKTILKNLNRLGLLIEKNDSLQVISLFQLCENQLDKLNDDGEKIGYMNSYQKHRVRYYAKNDPSQLELKTKAEQKIVRSICEDYLGEYDLAFSCNEFHICTLTIQHIVNLYDVLRKVDNDDRLESIANRINTNLKILSDKIASIKERSEEL